jgi:hypothetical protein
MANVDESGYIGLGSVIALNTDDRRRVYTNSHYYYYPTGYYIILNHIKGFGSMSTVPIAMYDSNKGGSITNMATQLYYGGISGFSTNGVTDMGARSDGDFECSYDSAQSGNVIVSCSASSNNYDYLSLYLGKKRKPKLINVTASNNANIMYFLASSTGTIINSGDLLYLSSSKTIYYSTNYYITCPAGYYRVLPLGPSDWSWTSQIPAITVSSSLTTNYTLAPHAHYSIDNGTYYSTQHVIYVGTSSSTW